MAKPYLSQETDVSDADLVAWAQQGDDRAFALLVARCEPMLRAQVARLRLSFADAEDMGQEGLLGLLAAVRSFRIEGGASFRTYAAVCVRNRMLSALHRYTMPAEVSLDEDTSVVDAASMTQVTDPEALLVARETAENTLSRLQGVLTAREYAVLVRYLDGYSYAEIATMMQMTAKAVDNALQRVRRKLATRFPHKFG